MDSAQLDSACDNLAIVSACDRRINSEDVGNEENDCSACGLRVSELKSAERLDDSPQ